MMSAKTVLTETPVCSTPASNINANAAAAAGEMPTDFQNLLAGAVAPLEPVPLPALIDTLPAPSLAPVFVVKNPAQPKVAAGSSATTAPLPTEISPADLLKILDDAATLLPEGAECATDVAIKAGGEGELPTELLETEEPSTADEELLCGWPDLIMPVSVFLPQAGSNNPGDASPGQRGGADTRAQGTPASLLRQALVPGQLMPVDVAPPDSAPGSVSGVKPDLVAIAQNPVTAFAAALTTRSESTEKDKPSADGWMSALGDLSAKRGHEVATVAGPRLSVPVHDARWADALAHRLVMMARDGESSASLKLVPVDLGPLDIQITVRDGEASVHFGAAHQETRNVLEASLPRLRELLGAQGLQLANASVSHQSGGQNRPEKSAGPATIGAVTEDAEVAGAKAISLSLLDIYA
jgi:flagellar hook-length control protein FliK